MLSAVAARTRHIGLVASASTTYADPYSLARAFASLDHISEGRASWNVVTTLETTAAGNFGRQGHVGADQRYTRAGDFLKVVRRLWDTWEDDAFTRDPASGQFADPSKYHRIDYHSEFFDMNGGLNVERPPQGHPVIFVAGSSEQGKELAAGRSRRDVYRAARHRGGKTLLRGRKVTTGQVRSST